MGEAKLEIHPLTRDRWDDLVTLFDRPGDPKGCWCMFYRVRSRDFEQALGQGRQGGLPRGGRRGPAARPARLPRRRPGRLVRRRPPRRLPPDPQLARPSAQWTTPLPAGQSSASTWCRSERRGGVAAALLEAAVAFAADHGATAVEGYPKDTDGARKHANEMFVGSLSMFAEAGFTEVGPPLPHPADHAPRPWPVSGGPGGRGGSR